MSQTHYAIIVVREDDSTISLIELAERAGCPVDLARWLVNYGLVEPVKPQREELRFTVSAVDRLCRALRLKYDFGLNVDALGLVMDLLDRIDELERQLNLRR